MPLLRYRAVVSTIIDELTELADRIEQKLADSINLGYENLNLTKLRSTNNFEELAKFVINNFTRALSDFPIMKERLEKAYRRHLLDEVIDYLESKGMIVLKENDYTSKEDAYPSVYEDKDIYCIYDDEDEKVRCIMKEHE